MIETLAQASTQTTTVEAVIFWVLAPIALGSAIAMVFARSAVHAALLLVLDFFCLAVFYAVQDAPFLAAVQVIVYTGAIMILFLFVLMLIGAIGRATLDAGALGLEEANSGGNVLGIAKHLFGEAGRNQDSYFLAFELTSALLITAAIGAMVLTHTEKKKVPSQREQVIARFKGTHPTPLSGPGVFAETHGEQEPALLPGGEPLAGSAQPRVTGGDE